MSIDDPAFLFESNEGFQEVTSKKAAKIKAKAAQEEEAKKQKPVPGSGVTGSINGVKEETENGVTQKQKKAPKVNIFLNL